VRRLLDYRAFCDDVTDASSPARFARRRLLKAAVFGPPGDHPDTAIPEIDKGLNSDSTHTVTGCVLDVSPHVLILQTENGEERLTLAASTVAWRGSTVAPAALRQGDRAIVKRNYVRGTVADRIWAEIGRVTGTIVERDGDTLLVDAGTEMGREILVIPSYATGRIQVRFPLLEPGYLIDVIGLRRPGFLVGLVPATSQPPYRADQPPSPPTACARTRSARTPTATAPARIPRTPPARTMPAHVPATWRQPTCTPLTRTWPGRAAFACPTSRWGACCGSTTTAPSVPGSFR
jgi:hypothetical protein